MNIDIRTLIFVLGVTHIIQVVVFGHQYLINKTYRGIGWWLLWSVAEIIGFTFMLLRQTPSLRSTAIIGQNAAVVLGVLFLYVGIRRFLDRKMNLAILLPIYAGYVAALMFFLFVRDDIQVRGIIISAALAAFSFLSAQALFANKPRAISASANFVFTVLMIHGSYFTFRAVAITIGARADNFFTPTMFNVAMFMDALIVSILWTFGFIIMINQRLNAEATEAKEHFELIFNTSPDAALITTLKDGLILAINDGFTALTGYTRGEAIGKSSLDFNIWEYPADRQKVVHKLREKGFCENFESAFRGKEGNRIFGMMSAKMISLQGLPHIISVTRDITERKRAEEEIRRTAKELLEKNEELKRFTYAVSHDLKSPLVTIQTFLDYLEKDVRKPDAAGVEKDLGYIRNAAERMKRLLNELLRLSLVDQMANPSGEVPLQEIVKEALDLVAGRITGRGIRVDLTEEPVVLTGDRTRLVEVFQNLVDNAAKFMGDNPAPRVEIGVEQVGEEMVLHVRDNGIGIDPELQPMLFGLFHKLDPGSEGTGIGLALVKRVVEIHGGRIWVESEGPGKGTTFRFTLAKTRRGVGRIS